MNKLLDAVLQEPQAKAWLDELKTLNTNLEALGVLLEGYKDTGEAIKDIRTMMAGLLGWKVIAKEKRGE